MAEPSLIRLGIANSTLKYRYLKIKIGAMRFLSRTGENSALSAQYSEVTVWDLGRKARKKWKNYWSRDWRREHVTIPERVMDARCISTTIVPIRCRWASVHLFKFRLKLAFYHRGEGGQVYTQVKGEIRVFDVVS